MPDSIAVTSAIAFGSAIVGAALHGTYGHWRERRERPRLQIDYMGVEGAVDIIALPVTDDSLSIRQIDDELGSSLA